MKYQVDWGGHRGYLKLALKHRIPIVPTASAGADDFYFILGDGYRNAKRLLGTDILPLCLPLGVAGIPYPLGLPHPVAIRQLIGPPIELPEGYSELGSADAADPGPFWLSFNDPELTRRLGQQVNAGETGRNSVKLALHMFT